MKEDGSLGLSTSIDEMVSILKMNYLVYGVSSGKTTESCCEMHWQMVVVFVVV